MTLYQRIARECLEVGCTLTRRANGVVYGDHLERLSVDSRDLLKTVAGTAARVLAELERLRVETDDRTEWPASRSYAVRVLRPDGSRVWIATDERAANAVQREATGAGELVYLAREVLTAGELADWEGIALARRVFPEGRVVAEADRDRTRNREISTPRGARAAAGRS